MELQGHYENFQSLNNDEDRISYLKLHRPLLETYNINVDNLIQAWETGDWPHLRKRGNDES